VASCKRPSGSERTHQSLGRRAFGAALGLAAACSVYSWRVPSAWSEDHVVVAHPSAGTDTLSLAEARRMFGAQQSSWPNGTPALIVVPPKGSSSVLWMLEHILHMPETTYRRHLMNQVFRGVARHPIAAETIDDVVRAIASKHGAISVLPRSRVTAGIRVVAVQ
jgi:hypothetical protein